MKSRLCEMLDIAHPIIGSGMQWLSDAKLAAAISNAGGLGVLSAASHQNKKSLLEEIRKTKDLTDKPFAVNISMLPKSAHMDKVDSFFEAVLEEGIKVVETSGRSPEEFIPMLHAAGVKIIHKVAAVRYAKKAESIGVDAVTIVGFECGGHPGLDDVTSMILIPRAVDELKIPVIAGGGIADARGYVAARALGADGVVLGTRFVATGECMVNDAVKDWICKAQETDTKVIQYSIRNPVRVVHNVAADKVSEMEKQGATLAELMPIINGQNGRRCWLEGDLNSGTLSMGQAIGLINEIKTVQEVVEEIILGAEQIVNQLSAKY